MTREPISALSYIIPRFPVLVDIGREHLRLVLGKSRLYQEGAQLPRQPRDPQVEQDVVECLGNVVAVV